MMLLSVFILLQLLAIANIVHSELIRIPVHRNPDHVPNGTKSLLSLMHKYDITPTMKGRYHRDPRRGLVERQDDGSVVPVPAEDTRTDVYYVSPVTVGAPGQTLQLIFDSGSSDLWVWSTRLPQTTQDVGRANGVVIFDPTQSLTYQNVSGAKWRITYGDGSFASGLVGTDNVQIGNIVVEGQIIELASTMSSSLVQTNNSHGLFGLAFGSINTVTPTPATTPLENMIAQQDIPANQSLFTAYLGSFKDVNDPDKGESFYTFGGIDQSVVEASGQSIQYVPVLTSRGFWEFSAPGLFVNGQPIGVGPNTAIADTGTSLMLVQDMVANEIYKAVPGAVYHPRSLGWLFPENVPADQLPVISFQVGDRQITIEKEHLGYSRADNYPGYVYGGIQSRGSIPFDIWGDTFLKCVYAIFDAGNLQFGVVQRPDPTPNNTSFGPLGS